MNWRTMKIACAACRKTVGNTGDGLVFSLPRPARHHDVVQMMFRLGIAQDHTVTQGFLTDTGEFVRRKPALMIARDAGQLIRPATGGYQGPELFSEDLW